MTLDNEEDCSGDIAQESGPESRGREILGQSATRIVIINRWSHGQKLPSWRPVLFSRACIHAVSCHDCFLVTVSICI